MGPIEQITHDLFILLFCTGLLIFLLYVRKQMSVKPTAPKIGPVDIEELRRQYSYIDHESFDALVGVFSAHNALQGLPIFLSKTCPALAVDRAESGITPDPKNVAVSRAGGGPDLPHDMPWPRNGKDAPLQFLHQVNLQDIAKATPADNLLPSNGLLVFFYDYDKQPWGNSPEDWQGWKLTFVPEDDFSSLEYRLPPYELPGKMGHHFPLTFRASYSIPSIADRSPEEIGFPEEYDFRYALSDALKGKAPTTYFFGKPYGIQHDDIIGCARSIFFQSPLGGNLKAASNTLAQRIKEEIDEWFLLYQESGEFGDMGSIYFVMRKQDAANGNFDNVWLVLQSH